jgi:hypothetical protein
VEYARIIPIPYQIVCFIQRFCSSIPSNSLVEYIEIILIIKNKIIGIKILDSTLNFDMFLMLSHP